MRVYMHIPVLLKEVISLVNPISGEHVVDATMGGGGYSRAILEKIKPSGKLLGIDLDHSSLEYSSEWGKEFGGRLILEKGNFSDIDKIVVKHDFPTPQIIVADIGFSSYQLDHGERGLSFAKEELLDMRFAIDNDTPNAAFLVNHLSAQELSELFWKYGEEKQSKRVAQGIDLARSVKPIRTSKDLREAVERVLSGSPKQKEDVLRRVFQALRIRVNHELENLETFLPKAFDLLATSGRLAVVSFHSLEDRIVKQFFAGLVQACICPPEFPVCRCGNKPKGKLLTKGAVTATAEEIEINPRSKSAKLRIIQKIT